MRQVVLAGVREGVPAGPERRKSKRPAEAGLFQSRLRSALWLNSAAPKRSAWPGRGARGRLCGAWGGPARRNRGRDARRNWRRLRGRFLRAEEAGEARHDALVEGLVVLDDGRRRSGRRSRGLELATAGGAGFAGTAAAGAGRRRRHGASGSEAGVDGEGQSVGGIAGLSFGRPLASRTISCGPAASASGRLTSPRLRVGRGVEHQGTAVRSPLAEGGAEGSCWPPSS